VEAQTDLVMTDIHVGEVSGTLLGLALVFINVQRSAMTNRHLALIEGLSTAIRYDMDPLGSALVAESALLRVQSLQRTQRTEVALTGSWTAGGRPTAPTTWLALLADSVDAPAGPELIVDNHRLFVHGASNIPTSLRGKTFALVRVGREPAASKKAATPLELRRQYARIGGANRETSNPAGRARILERKALREAQRGDTEYALATLDEAVARLNPERTGEWPQWRRLRMLRGILRLAPGRWDEARQDLREAVAPNERLGVPPEAEPLLSDPVLEARLRRVFALEIRNASTHTREFLTELTMNRLRDRAERTGPPNRRGDEGKAMLSVVTPLAVEAADIPDGWEVQPHTLEPMRAWFWEKHGVRLPGLRFRQGIGVDARYLIDEVCSREVHEDAPCIERLRVLQPPLDLPPALELGVAGLFEALECDLSWLVGMQEVQNLLEVHCAEEFRADVVGFQTHSHIGPLTTIAKMLLVERTPILDFALIREEVARLRKEGLGLTEILAALRCHPKIASRLWGAGDGYACVRVPERTEAAMLAAIERIGSTIVLVAREPDLESWILELQALLSAQNGLCALVVASPELRPLLRAAIAPTLTDTPVLAQAELEAQRLQPRQT
jgi:hypothetical protein